MAEFMKLTEEEVAKLDKKDVAEMRKVGNSDVEGQGFIKCPFCDTPGYVNGAPLFAHCCECGFTFRV